MNNKRINLCFDLDDPRQKVAYDYLASMGREKSAKAIEIILSYTASSNDLENKIAERDARLVEQLTQTMKKQLEAALQNITIKTAESEDVSSKTRPGDVKTMSDDAFNEMMRMFG